MMMMSNFVHVERDSVQEEEELIEAVEALVETCAVKVKHSILKDWQELQGRVKGAVEWAFPILLEYKQQSRSVYDDLEHLAIAAVLFVLVFFILAPSKQQQQQQQQQPKQASQQQQQQLQQSHHRSNSRFSFLRRNQSESWSEGDLSANSSLDNNRWNTTSSTSADDETDEERFEKNWPSISVSRYHKLVLPPSCRLAAEKIITSSHVRNAAVAAAAAASRNQRNQRSSEISIALNDDSENPVKRFRNYLSHFLHLLKKIISYDYAGACWTIWQWLQRIMQRRRRILVSSQQDVASSSGGGNEYQDPKNNITSNLQQEQHEMVATAAAATTTTTTPPCSPQVLGVDEDEIDVGPHPPLLPLVGPLHEDRVEEEEKEVMEEKKGEDDPDAPHSPRIVIDHHQQGRCVKANLPTTSDDSVYHDLDSHDHDDTMGNSTRILSSPLTLPPSCLKKSSFLSRFSPRRDDHNNNISNHKNTTTADGTGTASTSTGIGNHHHHHHSSLEHLIIPECSSISTNEQLDELKENVQHQQRTLNKFSSPSDQTEFPHSVPTTAPTTTTTTTTPETEEADNNSNLSFFFEAARCQESLKKLSIEVPVPDKNGYILGDEFLPATNNNNGNAQQYTPLLVFVNSRAGPQQGHLLITQLRRLLNPIQVWDLADGGPEAILESFLVFTKLRILVCGGDGTVSWIVSALEGMKNIRRSKKWPPIAILPLGTGNDLARIHGWGGGYNNESLISVLEQISESYISMLDIWEVTIESKQSKKKRVKTFFNYLGVGADAQAALQVHYLRESRPEWFFSRLVNKAWYGVFGAEDIIMASSVNVRKEIKLIADGVEVALPSDSQGIIILNIDSYAGGVPLWSQGTPCNRSDNVRAVRGALKSPRRSQSMNMLNNLGRWNTMDRVDSLDDMQMLMSEDERMNRVTACDRESSCQDGILEIVSIRGAFHLGQIKVGLSNAQRLCQCREAVITIKSKVAVQVDGEPWRQRPCTLTVRRKQSQAVMLHRSVDDGGVETEMSQLLDWAEERQIIDSEIHSILMKEYSRRIESKTRKRRVKEQDNLVSTLKKAISQSAMANNLHSSQSWQGGIAF